MPLVPRRMDVGVGGWLYRRSKSLSCPVGLISANPFRAVLSPSGPGPYGIFNGGEGGGGERRYDGYDGGSGDDDDDVGTIH